MACRWFNCENNPAVWSNFAKFELAQNAKEFLERLAAARAGAAVTAAVGGFQVNQESKNP